jgi:hypothetical protein
VSVYGTGCFNLTLEVFLGSLIRDIINSAEALSYYQVQHSKRIFLLKIYLHPLTQNSVSAQSFHYSVTPSKLKQVLEYSPVCHQLRLSALPKDPTNPDPINVDQEPLVLRREDFSSSLSLLMPTFSFLYAPAYLAVHLQCSTECSPTDHPPCGDPKASVVCLMPDHFPCPNPRPVSCYALFK